MTNVIVYSFKGYDTAKHRYILRPAKATLERIRRIDDAVAVAGVGRRAAALVPGAHVAATGSFGREKN
jgi:hypothetical protein